MTAPRDNIERELVWLLNFLRAVDDIPEPEVSYDYQTGSLTVLTCKDGCCSEDVYVPDAGEALAALLGVPWSKEEIEKLKKIELAKREKELLEKHPEVTRDHAMGPADVEKMLSERKGK